MEPDYCSGCGTIIEEQEERPDPLFCLGCISWKTGFKSTIRKLNEMEDRLKNKISFLKLVQQANDGIKVELSQYRDMAERVKAIQDVHQKGGVLNFDCRCVVCIIPIPTEECNQCVAT